MKLSAKSNVSRWRMPLSQNFFVTNRLGHGAVQVQCRNGGTPGWTDSDGTNAVPAKMQSPRVAAGIKQANFLASLRVTRRQSCAFAKRTGNTSQREIAESCLAASVDGNDVVNVEGCFLRGLGEAAVFAPILCAMNDLTPELRRDCHAVSGGRYSTAQNASGATRAGHSSQQGPRPLASRRASGGRRCLACRAGRGAAAALPWGDETSPSRPASALSVGWLETYSFSDSVAQSIRPQRACPRLELLNPCSSVSIHG
jgi:hypothetical protein